MKAIALATALFAAACSSDTVDAPPIPATEYQTWYELRTWGELPGHSGDTFRIIYANPIARTYEGGQYPEGTILVKEIHDLEMSNGVASPGALQYVAIMRRLGPPTEGLSDEGGWLFSYTDTAGGSETHESYCWSACHVDAPFHGAWFDYSK